MTIRFLLLASVAVFSIFPAFAQDQNVAGGMAGSSYNGTFIGGTVAPDIAVNTGVVAPGVVQSLDAPTQVGGVFVGADGTVRPAIGTPAYTQGGFNTRGTSDNATGYGVMPVNEDGNVKKMSDMTPDERRALWEQMPEDQKQRILERRKAIAAERAQQDKWKNLSGKKSTPGNGMAVTRPQGSGATAGNVPGKWANDPNLTAEQKASIQRGANLWNGMSADQKKAFITKHQGDINAATQGRTYSGQ